MGFQAFVYDEQGTYDDEVRKKNDKDHTLRHYSKEEFLEAESRAFNLLGLRSDRCSRKESIKRRILDLFRSDVPMCNYVWDAKDSRFTTKHSDIIDFEKPLKQLLPYRLLRAADNKVVPHLVARQYGNPATDSILVATHPNGGFIDTLYPAHLFYNSVSAKDERQWQINPFSFLAQAFTTDDLPKPDVTTLVGRRIYYSHIDGDGWNNYSHVAAAEGRNILSARVLYEKILRPYNDLPVTIGPIAGDLDLAINGKPDSQLAARDIFSLPTVEPATHTYTHPYNWNVFVNGQPSDEAKSQRDSTKIPFSVHNEVQGSVAWIEQFLSGKPIKLFLWSGNTRPFEAMLKATREAGLVNLNGGDSRFDHQYPSVIWLAPIGRHVGAERQIYASMSNENTYKQVMDEPYDGFTLVRETIDRTESPRRLKPFNLYYHVFSADYQGRLSAVQSILDYARQSYIVPINASHYAAIAQGFYTAQFNKIGFDQWSVQKRGALQTIRFDQHGKRVDWKRSEGVMGQQFYQNSLYVALDPSIDEPIIALESKPQVTDIHYLIDSKWPIKSMRWEDNKVHFEAQGFGLLTMRWQVAQDGLYRLIDQSSGQVLAEASARDGRLEIVSSVLGENRPRQLILTVKR